MSFAKSINNLLHRLLYPLTWLLPLFAGPLIEYSTEESLIFVAAQVWAFFCLTILSWNLLRLLLQKSAKERTWFTVIAITFVSVVLVLSIHVLKERTQDVIFYSTLTLIALGAGAEALSRRNLQALSTALFYIYNLALAYLSMTIVIGAWLWQPVVVAFAFACLPTSLWLLKVLHAQTADSEDPISDRQSIRMYFVSAFLVLLTPVSLALFASIGELPTPYALLALPILFVRDSLPSKLNKESVPKAQISTFLHSSVHLCELLGVLLILLRLL